jgi:hypothetical protein
MRDKSLPPDVPVILISSGSSPFDDDSKEDDELWRTCHEEMVKASPFHEFVLVEEGTHDLMPENQELALSSVQRLIGHI